MSYFSAFQRVKVGYFWAAIIIIASSFGWSNSAKAQAFLEQLLGMQGTEVEGGLGISDLLNDLEGGFLQADEVIPEQRESSILSDVELILVHRFCKRQLTFEELEMLVTVPAFSKLEQDFCSRAGEVLLQFGYDIFDGPRSPGSLANGAIQDSYRLGIGDELVITFRGQDSRNTKVMVNREGQIILADLDPVMAAGRTFGDFKGELEAIVEAAFIDARIFVSMGVVRKFSISVIGEVYSPGIHQLTGLSTILDAIATSGGIKKTGSLRQIRIERAGTIFWIDLYDLLVNGTLGRDLALYEGDRIIVPVLGPTVAVAGKVLRPGIFELAEGQSDTSIADVMALAGGAIRPRGSRLMHQTFDQDGREVITEGLLSRSALMTGGDLVVVNFGENIQVGITAARETGLPLIVDSRGGDTVRLVGHVSLPGLRTKASAPTVSALLGGADSLIPGAYLPFAVLETTEPATQARRLFGIDLQRVLAGELDYTLRDNDQLIVLSVEDIRFLSSKLVQSVISASPDLEFDAQMVIQIGEMLASDGDLPASDPEDSEGSSCGGLDSLRAIVDITQSGRFNNAIQAMMTVGKSGFQAEKAKLDGDLQYCPPIYNFMPDLLPFTLEHVAAVSGEVRRPGAYPVTDGTGIASVVAFAGGVTRNADLAMVEITRFTPTAPGAISPATRSFVDVSGQGAAAVTLNPGDVVRFNAVFSDRESGPILLSGEFVRPGLYEIRRGELLSEVIARAGGITQQAYPYGAIFTRESIKRSEETGFARASKELDSAVASAVLRQGEGVGAISAAREIIAELTSVEALGRMVIEADPTVLQVRPELDVVMVPGDTLFMPKRPNTVLVIGDVLNPGALQFVSGTTAKQYVTQAGGLQESADRGRLFLVYPNGIAQPIRFNVWNYQSVQAPPGSTIVSPRNLAPFSFLKVTTVLTSILEQFAISAAALTVISR